MHEMIHQDPRLEQSIRAVSIAFRMVFNRSLDAVWGSAVPLALPHSAQALGGSGHDTCLGLLAHCEALGKLKGSVNAT